MATAPGRTGDNVGARRLALRIAVAATASFVVAEAFDWDFTFIGPMLAAQLLVSSRQCPTLSQGVLFVVVIGVANIFVLLLSTALVETPPVLVLALALVLFLSFYGQVRGAPDFVTTMFQISAVAIPVFTAVRPDLATTIAEALATGGLVAVLTVWAAHAAFPDPEDMQCPATGRSAHAVVPASTVMWIALRNTLIVMPALIWYLSGDAQIAVVTLIVIVTVIRQHDPAQGQRAALGLIVGNFIGGVAAGVAYALIQTTHSIIFFAIVCLGASLTFASWIVTGGTRAPLYAIAFSTFLILLGIGITPLPGGTEEAFFSRLLHVLVATAYAIGALSLIRPESPRTT
jgi:uncharacterized membrane protein YccC